MSYKKIVAGVATAVVASALVVPSAFALSNSDYNDLKDDSRYEKSDDFKKVEDLEANANAKKAAITTAEDQVTKAKADVTAAEAKVANAQAKLDASKDADKTPLENDLRDAKSKLVDAQTALSNAQKGVEKAKDEYKDAKDLFESKRDKLKDTDAKARTSKAYKDADSDSKKFAEDQVKAGKDLLVDVRTTDLTSLSKTYRDQVRTIETKAVALERLVNEIDNNYKEWEPGYRQAKAEELKQLIGVVKGALDEIPDAVLKDAKKDVKVVKEAKKDVKVVKVVKKGSALPKTSDVAPVAPIAAVAGSAALIAAGLVASRKVNA